jgi:aspartate dehydrogenase
MTAKHLRVAIAGFGAIGSAVAKRLDDGIDGLRLTAVSARDPGAAERRQSDFRRRVPIVALAELAERADIVVECAPAAVFRAVAEPTLKAGRIFMPLSVGALLRHMDLVDLARASGGRIIVPTGALLGLDAVRATAEGKIATARIVTRKPPQGLAGAPYLVENGISVDGLAAAKRVFKGSARDGAKGFPANVNVAAALSLAGIGPDATELEIWADPTIDRNIHRIEVEADSARLTMTIENVPSEENPRTGKVTALSVIAALRGLVSPLKIGT